MDLLILALYVYTYVLFARIILGWVTMFWTPPSSLTPVIRVIYELTEPIMAFFRRFIPPVGGFDFSPIVIFILIRILMQVLGSAG
ncbi:MAG TPA: YggT family protein [Actinomycetota bacterium]|nr:YggT family protein [Actinomycetota bacterium]